MGFFTAIAGYAAPVFLILSPILSYSDQAISMHRAKSSAGFSLDIPLIMLVASIFRLDMASTLDPRAFLVAATLTSAIRIFYWPGAKYDSALLVQSFCNIFIQVILLKIALDHRPSPSSKGGDAALPFTGGQDGLAGMRRPYNFWRWRSPKPYWQVLLSLFIALTILELLLAPFPPIYSTYSTLIGYIGLSVEATLPLPQLFANAQSRSCKGFRVSVLASWLFGDAMKMFWFFTSTTEIPLAFKLCGIFQACCDALIGVQYMMYGDRAPAARTQQDWPYAGVRPHRARPPSGRQTPVGRRTPLGEKTF
ncbi:Uu.00g091870.m01.CDS01 [Anthostomella pinea]|uniref:Uu.00g091870.m01.CDS01 n=1 Tax=Anthostomella pinea TaxID=933095 RepID=A0AAI8VN53_9PEZI|nr:Uu.00g091870.m01.CDS01 [Anthostomella pinea]